MARNTAQASDRYARYRRPAEESASRAAYGAPGEPPYAPEAYEDEYDQDAPYEEEQPIYTNPRAMQTEPEPDEPEFYDELPMDEDEDEPKVIATNRTVKLTCTLASFFSLLGLFYAFAEKDSRAIRHCAVQSAALGAAHVAGALLLLLFGSLLSMIPLLGFVMTVIFWVLYAAMTAACIMLRVQLMTAAHEGVYHELPMIGEWLERFV